MALGLGLLLLIKRYIVFCCKRKAIKKISGECKQVVLRDLAGAFEGRLSVSYVNGSASHGGEIMIDTSSYSSSNNKPIPPQGISRVQDGSMKFI